MKWGQFTEGAYTYWYERVGPILYKVQHDRLTGENNYIILTQDKVTDIDKIAYGKRRYEHNEKRS